MRCPQTPNKSLAWGILVAACVAASGTLHAQEAPAVDFSRDVRPILSNHCFKCHGPDAAERQGGLRLDVRDEALAAADSGQHAIVPGDPSKSELVERITSADADLRMPPASEKKPLTAAQQDILKRWIAAGAPYAAHWAFDAPTKPAIPDVPEPNRALGPIDRFLLARLAREGLALSQPAEKAALIRRVSLDLVGFPPTIAEFETFLADDRPDAYERLVDRMLASPLYGERMAVDWLDASRFADTHGYHIDSGRDMTRWREYVIDSFNENVPYNRFIVEQLAGDLLPATGDPERDIRQKVASGFNRNHMINFEGGAIPEEYLNAYIVDRVNTTGTVFLGLTVACCQCHDHKFDPLTQREYYQLYAFFNNVPENGLDGRKGNAAPLIRVPSPSEQRELDELTASIGDLESRLAALSADLADEQAAWDKMSVANAEQRWSPVVVHEATAAGGGKLTQEKDASLVVSGANPAKERYELTLSAGLEAITALRLEVLPDIQLNGSGPGRSVNGNIVLTNVRLKRVAEAAGEGQSFPWLTASADFSQADFDVSLAIDDDGDTGWAIHPQVGKPHAAVFELREKLTGAKEARLRLVLEFQSKFSQHQPGRFRVSVTSAADPHGGSSLPEAVAAALAVPAGERTAAQRDELAKYFREKVSPAGKLLVAELAAAKMRRETLEAQIPTSMVMQELPQPRETFLLERGAYDKRAEKVSAALPAFLPPLPEGAPANRLGLAEWLVAPEHPLTARVTVNRYWQLFFGTGLVKTAEDFGTQGELPSHPDLLDYLAVEFQKSRKSNVERQTSDEATFDLRLSTFDNSSWDVKHLVRRITTSAAYRQSSAVAQELAERDPENRLLARGPRFRLQAEFIRDQALWVSGLYDGRLGGKSVSPYQPAGLWEELMSRADGENWSAQKYEQDHGADLYRRTMYTFWKRTCPPPTLATLDAPDRETCTVRRSRTNTPLQALVLMNDPTYVEASRKFAERILREGGSTNDERFSFAFRTVLSREPSAAELAALGRLFARQQAHYESNPDAAKALLTIGESPADATMNPAELATWTMVASAILNTDEALTKG
jgi:hypothetical protein